jgi:S-(hydroxymethyl)glutathione dehydrogenase/alcohol dehydrogenase
LIAQGYRTIAKGGTTVCTGIGSSADVGIPIPMNEFVLSQKRLQGSLYGECSPSVDIPRLAALYRAGTLKLDELITKRYSLDELTQGYEDMHAGDTLRGVVVFD